MSERAIGIDIGGTKIAAALVALGTGEIVARRQVPTERAPGAVAAQIAALVAELGAQAGPPPRGVGIGVPELVSTGGEIVSAWNFPLKTAELTAAGRDLPVLADSDVRCGARGEMIYGAGRAHQSFSYVSIGTGISAAQVIGRRIHAGAHGFAIHFGSSDLVHFGPGGEAQRFNLEESASGLGMARALGRDRFDVGEALSGALGPGAQALSDAAVRAMASYLGQMVNMLDPEAIVIGGGMGLAPAYLDRLRAEIPDFIWAESCKGLPVLGARLGGDAGIIGAAALFAVQSG